jgi:DNA segregation ATPase FtsK/SpoIIIE, S-DNA-T family
MPDNTIESNSEQSVLADGPRRLVRALRELLAEREQRKSAIETEYRKNAESTEQELARETERIETECRRTVSKAETDCEREIKRIERDFASNERLVKSAYAEDRDALQEMAEDNLANARKQRDESIWLSEAVYEGALEQPKERYEQACREIENSVEEADRLLEKFSRTLGRARISGVVGPVDGHAGPSKPRNGNVREQFDTAIDEARAAYQRAENDRFIRMFTGFQPIILLAVGIAIGAGVGVGMYGVDDLGTILLAAVGGAIGMIGLLAGLYAIARMRGRRWWSECRTQLGLVKELEPICIERAADDRRDHEESLREVRDREVTAAKEKYEAIRVQIGKRREARMKRIEEKYPARLKELEVQRTRDIEEANSERDRIVSEAKAKRERELSQLRGRTEPILNELRTNRDEQWGMLQQDWTKRINELEQLRAAVLAEDDAYFFPWDDDRWNDWDAPTEFPPTIRFGKVAIDLNEFPGGVPDDERLPMPMPTQFDLPALLDFPADSSLLAVAAGKDDDPERSIAVLQNTMLRLLTALPPGKVRFTILDPVGLGQNFAGFMHLADYNEELVGSRIWTEQRHIEQRLTDLTEHMEKVIQKYLRNEYATIDEYNQQAGEIAEPYRFLVIADFPSNFSESALRRLNSIVTSGARCGVFTLIAQDARQKLPDGFEADDLHRHSLVLNLDGMKTEWDDDDFLDLPLTPERLPDDAFITRVLNIVGEQAIDAGRVEVPFETIAPDNGRMWSLTTDNDIRVPLGKCGATKLQYLTLGRGTAQHALIAGKTGSGKSTLLHALVTNVSLWYSPDEVELYLVDFKKGVEFKTYATHHVPHIRAIAIESDREFGLSVLERLDQELQRRGELYRKYGVQDLAGFRRAAPDERMPRTLLIIDEFQELFVEDDKIAQDAAMLLDRLVRQGRAFGVHVLLGSQTLGGAYTLARSTIGQMAVRIALQCSEADSYLILSDDNAAARLLSRPGEAIYNDSNGMIEGNSPFQVVWLPEPTRDRFLKLVEERTQSNGFANVPAPIVFEGNVPADIRRNEQLASLLSGNAIGASSLGAGNGAPKGAGETVCWLGEAIAIKEPTAAVFRRHSGHNLLMVGQRDDAALAIQTVAAVSIAARHPDATLYLFDGSAAGSTEAAYIEKLPNLLPRITRTVRPRDVAEAVATIAAEFDRRQSEDDTTAPPIFLLVYALHRFRDLRQEDDFSFSMEEESGPTKPSKRFADILRDGPALGIHTMAWCDTVNNVNRTLDRSLLREFEMRLLFQMSPSDSSMLIDSPNASKLGFHRGLYHSEEEGREEKFRPYALPEPEWLKKLAAVGQR